MSKKFYWVSLILCCSPLVLSAQLVGKKLVIADAAGRNPLAAVTVLHVQTGSTLLTDTTGSCYLPDWPGLNWRITAAGYETRSVTSMPLPDTIWLKPLLKPMDEVVVTGTQRTVLRSVSPVPVEVYTPKFFRKNPGPALFDVLQQVNGVRPQLNCNVCNTGDIHINGMEGPYTLILIDGMPVVSNLAAVYGLSGIPVSLIERVEIVKGPASSLYGAEAIGGLINVITRHPAKAPRLAVDFATSTWKEQQLDLALRQQAGKKLTLLSGVQAFWFDQQVDKNRDGFTDVTLQKRISFFSKMDWKRKAERAAGMAFRYLYEDRWGGELGWTRKERGGDRIYGESIYTSRFEWMGQYRLPLQENLNFTWSWVSHQQDSRYGITSFIAAQQTGFGQVQWNKDISKQHLLAGLALRYTQYNDNTLATALPDYRSRQWLPGIFLQDEWELNEKQLLLGGIRWDQHPVHGAVVTPRFAWKYRIRPELTLRLNAGTGFRTVNVFTEDHAALTGARTVEMAEILRPERSINVNVHLLRQWNGANGWLTAEGSAWFTRFSNRIVPDYTTDPNKIIYSNLDGYALSRGLSLSLRTATLKRIQADLGLTIQDLTMLEQQGHVMIRRRPLLTERWSATGSLSYSFPGMGLTLDYTGSVYGPMLLPLVSELDPRPGQSPVWSLHNLQATWKSKKGWEIYAGIKNLFNWTPARGLPFLIARAQDPFDKNVQYTPDGKIQPTAENPYALSFDPNYTYAPNQGRRGFVGVRVSVASSQ